MTMKIYFAPLQGLTDRIYRDAHASCFGGISDYFTPFVRLDDKKEFRKRDLKDIDPERQAHLPVPQVIAGDPEELHILLEKVYSLGYQRADINLGCSFPLIARKGKGAGLLPYPEKVASLLTALTAFPDLLCSVKMRLGWEYPEESLHLLPVLEDAPVKSITLHARLGIQEYKGEIDMESFHRFYEQCHLPLFYNGDLCHPDDIKKIREQFPRLEGVMIGRALLAMPDLAEIYTSDETPSGEERLQKYRLFHDKLLAANMEQLEGGEHQIVTKMKGYWEYFMPETEKKLRKKVMKANKLNVYREAVSECFRQS